MKKYQLATLFPPLLLRFGPVALQAEERITINWRNVHITMIDAASGKVVSRH